MFLRLFLHQASYHSQQKCFIPFMSKNLPFSFQQIRVFILDMEGRQGLNRGSERTRLAHQNRCKGSFGGRSSPASALGEAKTDTANPECSNSSRSDVVGVSSISLAGAASRISSTDGMNESGFVNKEQTGRGFREENIASPSRFRSPGSRRGGGRGGRWNDGRLSQSDKIDALGRTLVRILRHQASQLGLEMLDDGFVDVEDLLQLQVRTSVGLPLASHNIEDVHQAVKEDNKQRLGIINKDGKLWIRANQGHSLKIIDSEKLLKLIETTDKIPVCIHGTYMRNLPSILHEGLKRMGRIHIHFASGLPKDNGVISGMRSSCQVLIYLDVAKALNDNMKLFISENGVILTEGFDGVVPPGYFKKVINWPEGTQIKF